MAPPPHLLHRRTATPRTLLYFLAALLSMAAFCSFLYTASLVNTHHYFRMDDSPYLAAEFKKTTLLSEYSHLAFQPEDASAIEQLERKVIPNSGVLFWDPREKKEGNRSLIDVDPSMHDIPAWIEDHIRRIDDKSNDAERCKTYGFGYNKDAPPPRPRRLFLGSMIADESWSILQTLATEIKDMFHTVAFIESNTTGNVHPRNWRFPPHSQRRERLGSIFGHARTTVDYYVMQQLKPSKNDKMSGHFLNILREHQARQMVVERWKRNGMRPDDVAVFSDADEGFLRDFLRALQVCDIPEFRPNQDCKEPKILGRALIFESSPECVLEKRELWRPDALLGECVELIGDEKKHPPPLRTWDDTLNYRINGHGLNEKYDAYFALTKQNSSYPLWNPADIRRVAGGRQIDGRPYAYHAHNKFVTGAEIRNKYLKYAEDLERATHVPLSLIHEDVAVAVACAHKWTDHLVGQKRLLAGGFQALQKGTVPLLYTHDEFRSRRHQELVNLVKEDERIHGVARKSTCNGARCAGCGHVTCDGYNVSTKRH